MGDTMHDYKENLELVNMDAWSDGQMRSKLWLCDLLEKDFSSHKPLDIWIMGSWYGLLAQVLLLRGKLPIKRIRLFDIDPSALKVSQKILISWIIENKSEIVHHHMDCAQIPSSLWETRPDVVINTSCEHFQNESWFSFPKGIHFYIQSTNMNHPTHINKVASLEDFKIRLGEVTKINHALKLEFRYPKFQFDRYMISGIK